ncbi:MAG: PhzF family phenazine biosynthesis protein [Flavobacteriales bacterium]|nr:PhzF family phenazine biosynthesis protein [Flavobacteriales bacterium]MCB9447702.1 PhzF family phenazine biosynthesis protein [Flavobacteriales bacterium]
MNTLSIYQVDAFTSHVFGGNPAAVVPLQTWLPDATMQAIAMENNLAETVFFVKEGESFRIRWFTPAREVDLCGHATLAAAHVLFRHLSHSGSELCFSSASGILKVIREGEQLSLDFPSRPPEAVDVPPQALTDALGLAPMAILKSRDYLVVYPSESDVRSICPDFRLLQSVDSLGIIITAPGDKVDFVSRFFAPAAGIDEDPVTGSAHCTLIPYWAQRLGRNSLQALQLSARGGALSCVLQGDRVLISGRAVTYLEGRITV